MLTLQKNNLNIVLKQFFIEENREAHTGSVRCELSNEPPDIARLLRFDKL